MAVMVSKIVRRFNFNGLAIPDPDPKMPPERVVRGLTTTFPELTNAKIEPGELVKEGEITFQTFNLKTSAKPLG